MGGGSRDGMECRISSRLVKGTRQSARNAVNLEEKEKSAKTGLKGLSTLGYRWPCHAQRGAYVCVVNGMHGNIGGRIVFSFIVW